NAGMMDVVLALEWVRDNIERFGGDPKNVTIFGQSGGAGKVATLMGMTPAKGLFHRAIMQSGSNVTGMSKDAASKAAQAFMMKLGAKSLADLQKLSMDQIRAVSAGQMRPVVDGKTLPRDPFAPDASPLSADIPVLTGTTETEVTFFPNTQMDPIDDATLLTRVKQATRTDDTQAKNLIDLYRKGRPGVSNINLPLILESNTPFHPVPLPPPDPK